MVDMVKPYNMTVITEGIESQRQEDELRALGVKYGEGFYYSQATSVEKLSTFVKARKSRKINDGSNILRLLA